jgi:malate dehydrogenase (oxaloacetate-decarboxylating)
MGGSSGSWPPTRVFALANPTPEIMPEEAMLPARRYRGGSRTRRTTRSFPGIVRGALDHGVRTITEEMNLAAARALAGTVPDPTAERILPTVFDPAVVPAIAAAIR